VCVSTASQCLVRRNSLVLLCTLSLIIAFSTVSSLVNVLPACLLYLCRLGSVAVLGISFHVKSSPCSVSSENERLCLASSHFRKQLVLLVITVGRRTQLRLAARKGKHGREHALAHVSWRWPCFSFAALVLPNVYLL
jgi:hypothetical protein